jgi:hypothetical protein
MKILVACEYSGRVRDAFIRAGHNAVSCDILPSESGFGPHVQGDLFDVLDQGWDMMIAHPPCTYLTNAGVTWLYNKDKSLNSERWGNMEDAAFFFKKLMDAPIPKIAIENPIMHGHAKKIIGTQQSQVIQPWMFGHTEQKATCLWLKGLPKLMETNNVKEEMMKLTHKERQRLHFLPPSKDRAKIRSLTYQGIADAMANQWG